VQQVPLITNCCQGVVVVVVVVGTTVSLPQHSLVYALLPAPSCPTRLKPIHPTLNWYHAKQPPIFPSISQGAPTRAFSPYSFWAYAWHCSNVGGNRHGPGLLTRVMPVSPEHHAEFCVVVVVVSSGSGFGSVGLVGLVELLELLRLFKSSSSSGKGSQ